MSGLTPEARDYAISQQRMRVIPDDLRGRRETVLSRAEGLRAWRETVLSQGLGTGVKTVQTDKIHPRA